MEFYEIVKSIGSGSFGQVYLARNKREDRLYVIKRIKIRDMTQKDRENTENEVRLLQKLRHPNIVAYKDSYLDREQYLNIVMIHCEGGDIYQKIRNKKSFPESQILDWFAQMTLALCYLHEQKILHRDLKTQNVFLKNGRVRLGDFGIAKVLDSTRDLANTCIGTPYYMSPELFKYKPYSYKSDVWALGCCLYEMCNLRHAFDAQSMNGLALKILKGSYPSISQSYSKGLRELINKMLNVNPKARPTIQEIVHKPIIKLRIIYYMLEVLSEPSSADLDDMYVDTLYEQAQQIGVLPLIQHYQKQMAEGSTISDIKNELEKGGKAEQRMLIQIQEQEALKLKQLRKEQFEKKKLEEEIKRLEQKQQSKSLTKNNDSHLNSKGGTENFPIKSESIQKTEVQTKTDYQSITQRKVSLERERRPNDLRQKQKERSLSLEKDRLRDDSNLSAKDKVIQKKQKREEEKILQGEKERQLIYRESFQNRKLAQERKQAQYRQSKGSSLKAQDEYDLSDDSEGVNAIQEIENEDEYEEDVDVDQKLDLIKTKLKEKTVKISQINQSLHQNRQVQNMQIKALETGQAIPQVEEEFDNEEVDDEEHDNEDDLLQEDIKSSHQITSRIQDRIKLLKHRCEGGLGSNLADKALALIRTKCTYFVKLESSNQELRKQLIVLLGEENIGYWQLFDQILYMEDLIAKY
ncbi:unnamed protein product (macronuclear) [Paramecium tetraurelia]|uniref:non-specific serine/threonine protein kinase n=1 Tax=Paramecium tetraurelia TaxID=5888 RepID=A0DDR4_PARTE|nr:uncharacterized protein GSPATT00016022001 [Paramecium tetraurelia]CAK81181.1 unnamed protein product [Paramecium tetraurelia]|eukprot:XP_001448578.1 hypothetical protein (macronuclear) [Paramecium tetraurelia strain d4-2]